MKKVLDEITSFAVAGIAALKVLSDILPESAKSVESTAIALTGDFKILAENARQQSTLASALMEKADMLEAAGQTMTLAECAALLDRTLGDLTRMSAVAVHQAEEAMMNLRKARALLEAPGLPKAQLQNITSADDAQHRKVQDRNYRF